MKILDATQAIGDVVQLARTNADHLSSTKQSPSSTDVGSFEGLLMRALNGVNDLSIEADRLGQQMIVNPDSVDTHDVTIAMAQANLAISLTKAVVDGALQAYSGIINMR